MLKKLYALPFVIPLAFSIFVLPVSADNFVQITTQKDGINCSSAKKSQHKNYQKNVKTSKKQIVISKVINRKQPSHYNTINVNQVENCTPSVKMEKPIVIVKQKQENLTVCSQNESFIVLKKCNPNEFFSDFKKNTHHNNFCKYQSDERNNSHKDSCECNNSYQHNDFYNHDSYKHSCECSDSYKIKSSPEPNVIPAPTNQNESQETNNDSFLTLKAGVGFLANTKNKTNIYDDCEETNNTEIKIEDSNDTNLFIGADLTINHSPNLDFGVGSVYELNKDYSNIPVYVFVKKHLNETVSITGSLGYNFFTMKTQPDDMKIDNGMYYAFGLESMITSQLSVFGEFNAHDTNFEIKDCENTRLTKTTSSKFVAGLKFEI